MSYSTTRAPDPPTQRRIGARSTDAAPRFFDLRSCPPAESVADMNTYPVDFELERPASMSRSQVFLRIAVLVLVSMADRQWRLARTRLPRLPRGCRAPHRPEGRRAVSHRGWGPCRPLGGLTVIAHRVYRAPYDELPGSGRDTVRVEIARSGSPTVGSALLRIFKAVQALWRSLLGLVSSVVWLFAAISILVKEECPEGLWNFRPASSVGTPGSSPISPRLSNRTRRTRSAHRKRCNRPPSRRGSRFRARDTSAVTRRMSV